MKVVVRIGGSVLGSPPNPSLINDYVNLLKKLKEQRIEIVAVVGGGLLARHFIQIASKLGLNEKKMDWAAIHVSRLFAQLFLLCLGDDGCESVPVSVDEAQVCLELGKIVVMGGLRPGMTTDSVAALIGERIKADLLVKGSNVEGIYNKDPNKDPNAKMLRKLRFNDLSTLFEESTHKVGINQIIDPEAVKILQRCKLKTVIVNGSNSENLLAVVKGKNVGTVIT